MADLSYVKTLLRQIADLPMRRAMDQAFTHVLGNLRFGVPEHQARAVNHQLYFVSSTVTTSTGEFTLAHGLGSVPRMALPVLDLSQPGASLIPLEVSRAADATRVYLKSTSTGAAFWLLVE